MPIKELMNWVSSVKRWRVMKNKKTYWYNPINDGLPRTKEGSREGANKFWEKKEAELNQANQQKWNERKYLDQYDTNIAEIEKIIAIHEQFNDEKDKPFIQSLKAKLKILKAEREKEFTLKRLTYSRKSPLQITSDDTFEAVVDSIGEPADYLVSPGEEDFEQFFATNNDVPNAESLIRLDERLKLFDKIVPSKSAAVKKDESLQFYIDRFIKTKRLQAEADGLSISRVTSIVYRLNKFAKWFGSDRSVKEINMSILEDYFHLLLKQVAAKKTYNKTQTENKGLVEQTASDLIMELKSFVRYLDEDEIIVLPKRIHNKAIFTIRKHKTINKNVPISDIKVILKSTNIEERMKLFILLALNCGMYQSDISDLLQSEVDWEEGRITRRRSKTKGFHNVPTVSYKLWNETFTLLKKYRTKTNSNLVLLNENGTPLLTIKFAKGGNNGTKSDCIKNAWFRAQKKLQMSYQFKLFRKTSANLIANSEHRGFEDLFLGHAPRSVSATYYTNPDKTILDEALQWLGGELGIK